MEWTGSVLAGSLEAMMNVEMSTGQNEGAGPAAWAGGLRPLPRSVYEPGAKMAASMLLGHVLMRKTEAGWSGGVIVETEAYLVGDEASHGYRGRTERNRSMYGPAGHAYVYFIYGNHHCFNVVCRPEGEAEAVLVRALEPVIGIAAMKRRRGVARPLDVTNGPGKLCQALGIGRGLDGLDLCDENAEIVIAANPQWTAWRSRLGPVRRVRRVGLTKGAESELRYYLAGSDYVSRR